MCACNSFPCVFRCKRLPPCKARDIVSASADRGTPSPTSLWLVDLPPLAVCSFNSLFQPYSRPRCRVADCQSRLHPRFRLSVPICQRAISPSLPRAAYLPSALRSGNLPCALLGIEPNALAGWRVTHRAKHNLNHEIKKHIILVILPYPFPQAYRCLTSCRILRRALCRSVSAHWLASP